MKTTIFLYLLFASILSASSVRVGCRVNDKVYTANVSSEYLAKHSTSPNAQSLVKDIKAFERIAISYIETRFKLKIDLENQPEIFRNLSFSSLKEGDSTYYFAVFSIGLEDRNGKFNHYKIPMALDQTIIEPKLAESK